MASQSEQLLKQLHEKAGLLGRGAVVVEVEALHSGFTRFAVTDDSARRILRGFDSRRGHYSLQIEIAGWSAQPD
jgi:hypothetical protein